MHDSPKAPREEAGRTRAQGLLLFATVLLVALNLRPAIASFAPLLETIRAEVGLSHAAAGALTTLPVLCMGAFPLAAAWVAERVGLERAIFLALALVAAAVATRLAAANAAVLFGSTLVAGIAIAAGQTLTPAFIKARFAGRTVLAMGLYSTTLTVGVMIAAAATAPLARAADSWAAALALFALPAALAAMVWAAVVGLPRPAPPRRAEAAAPTPWRSRTGWLVTLFSGGTFLGFYGVLAWAAPLYWEQGWSVERTGFLLTGIMLFQIAGNLCFALVAQRATDRRPWMVVALLVCTLGFAGMGLAPLAAPWTWAFLIGVGSGGVFPLTMNLPLDYAPTPAAAWRLTAMAQTGGYLIAAPVPAAMGALRGLTGGFEAPFLLLAAACVVQIGLARWLRPAG